jgi:hypothetical protein
MFYPPSLSGFLGKRGLPQRRNEVNIIRGEGIGQFPLQSKDAPLPNRYLRAVGSLPPQLTNSLSRG